MLLIVGACSAFPNASLAVLVWFAITRCLARRWYRGLWSHALLLGGLVATLNLGRLVFMAVREDLYFYFHDGPGTWQFKICVLILVVLFVMRSIRASDA
jgi:hypothetical protein